MYIDALNPAPPQEKAVEELPMNNSFEEKLLEGVFMETLRQMQRHELALKKAMKGH
ncbi:MAG: hypothetical protein WCN87_02630 [Chlamydiota bacterium]